MLLEALNGFDPRYDHCSVSIEIRVIKGLNKLTKLGEDWSDVTVCGSSNADLQARGRRGTYSGSLSWRWIHSGVIHEGGMVLPETCHTDQ